MTARGAISALLYGDSGKDIHLNKELDRLQADLQKMVAGGGK